MADHKLILSATSPDGLDASKTIAVNPDASNEQLKTFGQMLNAFTQNTYGKTDRIIKVNCDTEAGGGTQTPTLQLISPFLNDGPIPTNADFNADGKRFVNTLLIQYDGDGQIIFETIGGNASMCYAVEGPFDPSTHRATFAFYLNATASGQYVHFKIYATETENFKAVEAGTYQFVAINI